MDVKTYGRLDRVDGHWRLELEPHVMIRAKRMFPRVRTAASGHALIRDTAEVARDIEWLLTRWPLEMDELTRAALTRQADRHRESQDAVLSILNGTYSRPEAQEPARAAREYQTQAADMARATGRLLLVDDVGLGKTMSSLLVLRNTDALPALMVTLTHLPAQWLRELMMTWPGLLGHILTNGPVYDPRDKCNGHDPDVIITSYSKLDKWQHHLAGRVRTVVFDEVQELRHSASLKYTAAENIARDAAFRVGLTATPVYNYAGEIHNVVSVLAPDVLGTRDEFIREWSGIQVGMSPGNISVKDAGALGAYLRDQGVMLRRTRRDVGREIPEPVKIPHEIDTDHQTIDEAIRDAASMAELILSADADNRDRWRLSGELDWKMRHATGVAKAGYVADFARMILESEERIVLYGWHHDVYDIWRRQLADFKPVFYTGDESPRAKEEAVRQFAGDSRVLCVSLRAGAGLDGLQKLASVAVFGELDWSPGVHEQCIGRLWRDGQDSTVVAYYLISDAGSDPLMVQALNLKQQESDRLKDGDTALFSTATPGDRIRQLAQAVLRSNAGEHR